MLHEFQHSPMVPSVQQNPLPVTHAPSGVVVQPNPITVSPSKATPPNRRVRKSGKPREDARVDVSQQYDAVLHEPGIGVSGSSGRSSGSSGGVSGSSGGISGSSGGSSGSSGGSSGSSGGISGSSGGTSGSSGSSGPVVASTATQPTARPASATEAEYELKQSGNIIGYLPMVPSSQQNPAPLSHVPSALVVHPKPTTVSRSNAIPLAKRISDCNGSRDPATDVVAQQYEAVAQTGVSGASGSSGSSGGVSGSSGSSGITSKTPWAMDALGSSMCCAVWLPPRCR